MEEVRRPCAHRGTSEVLKSIVETPQGPIDFCICKQCRRFWLERAGWLLSRRETMTILRAWPLTDTIEPLAR
jgi:hypothetical protein